MKKINVGIVGAGAAASILHLPVFKQIPELNVISITDIDTRKACSMAERFGIRFVEPSLDVMLERDEIDLIDIITPVQTHYSLALNALEHGKHVFTEKPLTADYKEALTLLGASEKYKKILMSSQNHIFSNSISKVKSLIDEGYFGKELMTTISFWISAYKDYHWTANEKSGGLFFEMATHPFYIALYLFGKPDKISVFGNKPNPKEVMGWLNILFEKGDRTFCNIMLPPIPFHPSIELFGTKGSAYVNLYADMYSCENEITEFAYKEVNMAPTSFLQGAQYGKRWLKYAYLGTLGYTERAIKYILFGKKILNQYSMFNYLVKAINGELGVEPPPNYYLDISVNTVKYLEEVRVILENETPSS